MKIHLDDSFFSPPSDAAISESLPFYSKWFAPKNAPRLDSPSMERYIRSLYQLIGVKDEDSVFIMGSGFEAAKEVILSTFFEGTTKSGKNQIISSKIDEAAALLTLDRLQSVGVVQKMVSPDKNGQITAESVGDVMTPRTELVTLSWANGLTGVIHPVHEIAQLCAERGVKFHLEGTHVIGKLRFDLEVIQPDFLTFGGQAVGASCSSGVLYARKESQKFLIDALFDNAKLASLGKGAEETKEALDLVLIETARLRNKFESLIIEGIPEAKILFKDVKRLPHISLISFPGVFNELLLFRLHQRGVFATIGGGNMQQIALVLQECHIDEATANASISFSFSKKITDQEIEQAVMIIREEFLALKKCTVEV